MTAPEHGPVLVTGAAGFLGWWAARALVRSGRQVIGSSRDTQGIPHGVEPVALELSDGGRQAAAWVLRRRPAAILHLAAISDADACARDPELARRVNVEAAAELARVAEELGAWFALASTDLVFDGTHAPYGEGDAPAPLGPYMASKADAEREVRRAHPDALVARIALLYGLPGGRSGCFTDRMLTELAAGRPVSLFTDQHRTPLHVEDAAELLRDLLQQGAGGVVHLGGPERVSRYAHGVALARACGLPVELCRRVTMADVPRLSPRPSDVSLRIDRLRGLVGRAPWGIAEGTARVGERWRRTKGAQDQDAGGQQQQVGGEGA